jgi:DMSO/TMAO reductase YedYZ molybdopterin-dependent catalytic subunit
MSLEQRARRLRWDARLAGALATALAASFLWIASGLSSSIPFAPTALADRLVRILPGRMEIFFIEHLHHWALRLFTGGVLLASLIVGAELLARTMKEGRVRPSLASTIMALAAVGAALIEPNESPNVVMTAGVSILAGAIYAFVAGGMFDALAARGRPEGADAPVQDRGRRQVLRLGLAGGLTLAVGGGLIGWLARRLGGPDRNVALVAPLHPAVAPSRSSFPEIAGLSPEVTSAADHYVVDIDIVAPSVEAAGWSVAVRGLVDSPTHYSFQGLQRSFDVVQQYSVLTCISNRVGGNLIGNSAWGGVRLRDVLHTAGVKDSAVDVVFSAADGYTDSIPIEVALEPDVLLAVSQNGAPLLQEHGFPCRVRVPKIYGMKNVKWLRSIEVVAHDYLGFWQQRGWNDHAIVRTESKIEVAGNHFAGKLGEPTWVAGQAWAGDRGVSKVEVSTDGGKSWNDALLKDPLSPTAWRLWAYRWTPETRGAATLLCRATDGTGALETPSKAAPYPSGATGYDSKSVEVV